jgi:group II intron reverse transcriptase/maturase
MAARLMDEILSPANLRAAWEDVLANKSAPGVDGVTLARWGRSWEANLARLAERARANTYAPNRPRRFKVGKKGGGWRELSILTVSDKVLQRAVLNVIDDAFEKRFLNCSHGYRPNRSVATAVQQVIAERERGRRWVLDADISACFDSIDHMVLMSLMRRVIKDWFTLNLMEKWLVAGRVHRRRAVGIPMGAVLSPLWCNVMLHQLDAFFTVDGWRPVRYADDFVVMAHSQAEAEAAYDVAAARLEALKLSLHPEKTRVTHFDEGFKFLGVWFEKDSYSYIWKEKQVEVEGKSVKMLWNHPPDGYPGWRR